mgnify:CR=1 FL=1
MWSWLSRAFRSTGAAERAEAEGRFEDAVRLYVDAGSRDEAVRVLLAVADTTRGLEARRALLTRAATIARDDAQRAEARRRLARLAVEESEDSPPRTDDDRRALTEAARALEALGEHGDAARAYVVLEDREGIVRTLTLSGDVEALEEERAAAAGGVGWRLLGANNRELGRAVTAFPDAETAVAAIEAMPRKRQRE